MKHLYASLIIILMSLCFLKELAAQSNGNLQFNSAFEAASIEAFLSDSNSSYVDLFSCVNFEISDTESFENEINDLVANIDVSQYSVKKRSKLIKDVYEQVHKKFLKKYAEVNYFSDIFQYGNYNCVSATALYGIIFEKLDIPYVIKEAPTHVYLVAYPNEEQIIVETTSPTFGYIEMKADFKKEYVNYLAENKIISASELRNSSVDALFNEYYFDELEIKLEELIGLQYYNDAIVKLADKKFEEAYHQLLKAQSFYKSEKIDFLMLNTTYLWLQSNDLNAEQKFNIVCESKQLALENDGILGAFNDVLNEVMVEQGNTNKMDSLYTVYHRHFADNPDLQKMMNFNYAIERGRIAYNEGKTKEAMTFLENAVALSPDHADAKSLFAHNLIRLYGKERYSRDMIDSLENELIQFPFLEDNQLFGAFLNATYLVAVYDYFDKDQASKGLEMLAKFEQNYNEEYKENLNLELLGESYIEASKYYFRKGNMPKVREMLERALEFDPKNEEAQDRLERYF